ncbi:MAG: InlB B-repeat-containing protein [Spirochaetaceae bacterium]|jgi:uncharacterized repeat protein (TIGR02543 family)|nr:InlB B-repeat-containing protein [Spirochaetaceae bacterium]
MRYAMLVLAAAGLACGSCNVFEFVDGSVAGAGLPAVPLSDGGAFEGGTSEADADGGASLSMTYLWGDGSAEAARSVSGADGAQIQDGVGTLRNYFQMILVDEAAPDQIWDFDEERSSEEDPRPELRVGFLTGRTYFILILMGHRAEAATPTLLASGFLKQTLEAGENKLVVPLTPVVVGAEFVREGAAAEVRRPGRLARTVGLDARTEWVLTYALGSQAAQAAGRTGDALREATGDGVAPLRSADKAAYHGIDDWAPADGLRLVDNYAVYSASPGVLLRDLYEKGGGHGTNGVARYALVAGAPGAAAGSVFFNMVYAPFGFGALENWKDRGKFSSPVVANDAARLPRWIIRNGLSDAAANAGTDFALYDGTDSYNGNGALSVGVADPDSWRPGIFEDNNPWPIDGTGMTGSAGDLRRALVFLNGVAGRARYGAYAIRLTVNEAAAGDVALNGSGVYGALKDVAITAAAPGGEALGGLGQVSVRDGNSFADAGAKDRFTVAFNKNGGGTEAVPQFIEVEALAMRTVSTPPATVGVLPAPPEKAAVGGKVYSFAGWNAQIGGGAATAFSKDTPVVEDIEVFAQWLEGNPGDVPVIFDPQGGAVSPIVLMVLPGGMVDESATPVPAERPGWTFEGWWTAASGGSLADWGAPVVSMKTVYAHWSPGVYAATNGTPSGTEGRIVSISGTGRHLESMTVATEPAEGFRLASIAASPALLSVPTYNADGRTAYFAMPPADVTVTAAFASMRFTLSFDSGGGGAIFPQTVNSGAYVSEPAKPSRSGYAFAGWYSASEGGAPIEWPLAVTADRTVCARWGAITVSGVTVAPANPNATRGASLQFTAVVEGANGPSQGVIWTLAGASSGATVISSGGLLTVGMDEPAEDLTVRATSTADGGAFGTTSVSLDGGAAGLSPGTPW